MKYSHQQADIFVPGDDSTPEAALARVTHLCVAAHQDDIEIMAFAGIAACLDRPGAAFGGVVVTNGAGSPRTGAYARLSDEQMQAVRRRVQRDAVLRDHLRQTLQAVDIRRENLAAAGNARAQALTAAQRAANELLRLAAGGGP